MKEHKCYDFDLTKDNYNHITTHRNFYRFSGHVISYCPFCGEKLEDK